MLVETLLLLVASRTTLSLPIENPESENESVQMLLLLFGIILIAGALSLAIIGLASYLIVTVCLGWRRGVRLENTIPGSLDDEFEVEERLAELSPNEQNLYRSGQDFIKANPPYNEQLSLSNHLLIQEKGIEAWEFIPDPRLPSDAIDINDKTELTFNSFDYQCSIQTNLPIPKINDVYYFECKLFKFESPLDTIVSMGLSTKPYPYFRLPGRHLYSVAYDSNGSRRVNNSFKLSHTESTVFPTLQQGDVVGVGYRCRSGTIFFTRNGKKVSEKPVGGHIKGMRMNNLFPTIGSNNPCTVHVNLGQYGYVFIEANIKKWGYALKEGTRPPLPDYNLSAQDLLLESSNEDDDDDIIDPPGFYEAAGYESSNQSLQDNITLDTMPVLPPDYEEEELNQQTLRATTLENQQLEYEARTVDRELTPDEPSDAT